MKARSRLTHNKNKRLVKGIHGYYFSNRPKKTTRDYVFVNAVLLVSIFVFYLGGLLTRQTEPGQLISPYISSYISGPNVIGGIVSVDIEYEEVLPIAKVTAYSCGGLKTAAEINMNCPSLWTYPEGRTADGSAPIPYKTVACDRAYLGKYYQLEGIGKVKCTDTGGAIKGAGRFDLYVEDVSEAWSWGVKYLEYKEL